MQPESLEAIAERLVFLRSRITENQSEFARRHGMLPNTWNNYEKAVSRINLDEAKKLRNAYGISLDWLYLGVEAMMPASLMSEWYEYKKRRAG